MFNNLTHVLFRIFILCSFLVFQSCQKEDITPTKEYPNVDAELWQYFEMFEAQGKKRGVEIDLIASGITGKIGMTAHPNWVGQCNHNVNTPNHLIINSNFWNSANELRREKIVFHELGHCFLGKGHNDEAHADGTCKSIMRAGTGACIDNYTEESKAEYQDELFEM